MKNSCRAHERERIDGRLVGSVCSSSSKCSCSNNSYLTHQGNGGEKKQRDTIRARQEKARERERDSFHNNEPDRFAKLQKSPFMRPLASNIAWWASAMDHLAEARDGGVRLAHMHRVGCRPQGQPQNGDSSGAGEGMMNLGSTSNSNGRRRLR